MTAGRKPKPVELKILHGNPGKRPIPKNVPRPVSSLLPCPTWLTGEARAEWRRITRELHRLGVLAKTDRAALELYCMVYARWRTVEARLDELARATQGESAEPGGIERWVVTTESGYETMTVYLTIANKCITQMKQLLTEFGATPSSRTRVRVEQPKKEESLADKLRRVVND